MEDNFELQKIKDAMQDMHSTKEDETKQNKADVLSDVNPDQMKSDHKPKPKYPAYVGTKIILAYPQTQQEFLISQGKSTEGETLGDGYHVIYDDRYHSWSPKDVFERCYRTISPMERLLIV